jgi:hypothetical protein
MSSGLIVGTSCCLTCEDSICLKKKKKKKKITSNQSIDPHHHSYPQTAASGPQNFARIESHARHGVDMRQVATLRWQDGVVRDGLSRVHLKCGEVVALVGVDRRRRRQFATEEACRLPSINRTIRVQSRDILQYQWIFLRILPYSTDWKKSEVLSALMEIAVMDIQVTKSIRNFLKGLLH